MKVKNHNFEKSIFPREKSALKICQVVPNASSRERSQREKPGPARLL